MVCVLCTLRDGKVRRRFKLFDKCGQIKNDVVINRLNFFLFFFHGEWGEFLWVITMAYVFQCILRALMLKYECVQSFLCKKNLPKNGFTVF